jgi:chorismate--pyruvate lyase
LNLHSIHFPVGCEANWQSLPVQPSDPNLTHWLLDTGSLTEKLQSQCHHFSLQLLGQDQRDPTQAEKQRLAASANQNWQVREVILYGDQQPWVFARSVISQSLYELDMAEIGAQPLGQIIFNDARFVRQPFELCHLSAEHPLLSNLGIKYQRPLWGRRSLFTFQQSKLLIAEIFLPQSPAYLNNRNA